MAKTVGEEKASGRYGAKLRRGLIINSDSEPVDEIVSYCVLPFSITTVNKLLVVSKTFEFHF